jgi:hypothetical protein
MRAFVAGASGAIGARLVPGSSIGVASSSAPPPGQLMGASDE